MPIISVKDNEGNNRLKRNEKKERVEQTGDASYSEREVSK